MFSLLASLLMVPGALCDLLPDSKLKRLEICFSSTIIFDHVSRQADETSLLHLWLLTVFATISFCMAICRLPSSRCGSAWDYHDMTWYYPISLQSSNELHVSYIDSAKTAMHLDLRYMPCWQDGFTRHGIHVKSDHMTYAIIIWSCAISRHSKSLCDFSFICPVTSLVIGTTLWSVKLLHLLWASGWRTLLRLTPGSVWRQGTLFAQNTKSVTWMSGIWMKKH